MSVIITFTENFEKKNDGTSRTEINSSTKYIIMYVMYNNDEASQWADPIVGQNGYQIRMPDDGPRYVIRSALANTHCFGLFKQTSLINEMVLPPGDGNYERCGKAV